MHIETEPAFGILPSRRGAPLFDEEDDAPMQTLILCGGKGTRAYPHSLEVPKPLMTVGDVPILHHLLDIYARQGHHDFVLAAGYLVDMVRVFADEAPSPWHVTVVDTGEDTGTGGRIARCGDILGPRFLVTYGDGLGNVDMTSLLAFHDAHGGAVTVTAVPLPSPYGTLQWDDAGRVECFVEKPRLDDHWINAGFFVFEKRALEEWRGHNLETDVLPDFARRGKLFVNRHKGFFKSMDTSKDQAELEKLCQGGTVPWVMPGAAVVAS